MNPLTKNGQLPEAIASVIRANDSPRIRAYMEYATGRHKLFEMGFHFPMEVDSYGNSFLNTDGFSLDGIIIWEVLVQRHFWGRVAKGELSLSPQQLFRLPAAPQQTLQTSAEVSM